MPTTCKQLHGAPPPLENIALPSIQRTTTTLPSVQPAQDISFKVIVGFDADDACYASRKRQVAIAATFPALHLSWLKVPNPTRKPGPVFNALSASAVADHGCDYLYRINDDTELITPNWAERFISALREFDPPNFGVVGPTCHQGNTDILTHDFVHRSHVELFGSHYPVSLTDWWLDDWISGVYGPHRTRKLPDVEVVHRLSATRYAVTWANQDKLKVELADGAARISRALSARS